MLPGGVRGGCALPAPLSSLPRRRFAGSYARRRPLARPRCKMDANFGPGGRVATGVSFAFPRLVGRSVARLKSAAKVGSSYPSCKSSTRIGPSQNGLCTRPQPSKEQSNATGSRRLVVGAAFEVTGIVRLPIRSHTRRIRPLWTCAHRFRAIFQVTHLSAAIPHRFEAATDK